MSSQADFDKAAEEAKSLPDKTSNDDKLILYGLFKQATVGDCDTSKPGMFDPKGKAKWEAWNKQKGKDKSTAQEEYVM
ncbi:Acyl-CoA-binding domain-containing protein 2 [Trebouxia sp. C0009 RCD-2024]